MTTPAPVAFPGATGVLGTAGLQAAAVAAGLAVSASASWPETDSDAEVSPLAGFIDSLFSPLIAEVAGRALSRRDQGCPRDQAAPGGVVIAIVLVTACGDVASAASTRAPGKPRRAASDATTKASAAPQVADISPIEKVLKKARRDSGKE